MTKTSRSARLKWVFRVLLVLLGIGTPSLAAYLVYDPKTPDYLGLTFIVWVFFMTLSPVIFALFVTVCYRLLPVLGGVSSRSFRWSLCLALLSPIAGVCLYVGIHYIFSVVHTVELKRDYITLPEWVTNQQSALETSWRMNPSSQPWHDLLPGDTSLRNVRFHPNPIAETLSTYDRSTDTHTDYYKKSEMLGLNEVPSVASVGTEPIEGLDLDVHTVLFRNGMNRVDRLFITLFDRDARQSFFNVADCRVVDGNQQLILQLTTHFPQVRAQHLTVSGEVGDRTFEEQNVRLTENRLEITLPTRYNQVALHEDFYGSAKFCLYREQPAPMVRLLFDFSQGLRECLKGR